MFIKNILPLIICVLALSDTVLAQQDMHFSLYRYHMNMFNPAIAGENREIFLNLSHKSQWHGIENAPETQVISFGFPFSSERAGIGFNVINDAVFIQNKSSFFVSFSLKLPMSEKTNLFLGLQAGGSAYRISGSDLKTLGLNSRLTDNLLVDHTQFNPNIGVGVYIKSPKYFISLSAPKILSTKSVIEKEGFYTTATERVHTYISAGRNFSLSEDWTFTPYFLSRYVNYAPIFTSLNVALSKKEQIEFGVEYNLDTSMAGSLIIQLGGTQIGYAYSRSIHNQINQYNTGSHELLFRVKLGSARQNISLTDADVNNEYSRISSINN